MGQTNGAYTAFLNGITCGRAFREACHKSHFAWAAIHDSGAVRVTKPTRGYIS